MIQKRNYSRNRGLKWEELKVGVQVVMNTLADATMFTVREVNASSTMIGLQEAGTEHAIQWMDYSCCLHPNSEQLDYQRGRGSNHGDSPSEARMLVDDLLSLMRSEIPPQTFLVCDYLASIKAAIIKLEQLNSSTDRH